MRRQWLILSWAWVELRDTHPGRVQPGSRRQERSPGRLAPMLATLAALALAFPAAAASEADPVRNELERVRDMYRAITAYHVLVQGDGVTKEQVAAVLYDVEHYVAELETRFETGKLFLEDQKALGEIKEILVKAHLQAAVLHARGVDLEGSVNQYDRAIDLLGYEPAEWNIELEISGRPGTLSNEAEVAFRCGSPRELVENLKQFWGAGVVTRFKVEDYDAAQRGALLIERVGGATDPFSEASFGIARERFRERMIAGQEEFRLVLPPGHYRVAGAEPSAPALEFVLLQAGIPDPVVLNPHTFNFGFAATDEKCRPVLSLNGLPIRNANGIPYGTYRVQAPKGCTKRLPDKITVEQAVDVTVRMEPERMDYAKDGQPIFLFVTTPPSSTYVLRM